MARKEGVTDIDIEARRELVDSFDLIGIRRAKIVKILLKRGLLTEYRNPLITVKNDLSHVRKKRLALLNVGLKDKTVSEFIGQQVEILRAAMGQMDYRQAVETSKNIAKARGFNIDKIVVEGGDKDKPIQYKTEHSLGAEEARTIFGILREAGGLLPESNDAENDEVHIT